MASLRLLPLPEKPRLVGIARPASEADSIREGHNVEYFTLPAKSLLNRCISKRQMPFTWTINPYRGCEFGCRYWGLAHPFGNGLPHPFRVLCERVGANDYAYEDLPGLERCCWYHEISVESTPGAAGGIVRC